MYIKYINVKHIIYITGDWMVSVTLSVPKEMKEKMEKFPEINWSEVARGSIQEKIRDLEFLEEFKKQSEIDKKEAVELGRELNEKLLKHYEE